METLEKFTIKNSSLTGEKAPMEIAGGSITFWFSKNVTDIRPRNI
jgi:hypothetical protein